MRGRGGAKRSAGRRWECATEACRIAMAEAGWIAYRVMPANTFLKRLRGLIGRRPEDCTCEVLWFPACSSVHTFFMGHALDVVFADEEGRVLLSLEGVPPCRVVSCRGAAFALERFSVDGRFERDGG